MGTLFADVLFSLRVLRKSPVFTVVAVVTMAMAIGTNAVAFGVFNALILRPLNVPQPESLYTIERGSDKLPVQSYPDYLDLRDRNRSFDSLTASNIADDVWLDTDHSPSRVSLFEVSGTTSTHWAFDRILAGSFIRPMSMVRTVLPTSSSPMPIGTPISTMILAWWAARFNSTGILLPSSV